MDTPVCGGGHYPYHLPNVRVHQTNPEVVSVFLDFMGSYTVRRFNIYFHVKDMYMKDVRQHFQVLTTIEK
jgi:hypothetical protein